ncbi:MAG: rhomboid family intramembrane serine protease [Muribaculaceae bacterium]
MNFNNRGGFASSIPTVTKNLIIINALVWLATIVLPKWLGIDLVEYCGLHYWLASDFNPAQLVTYMFMHDPNGFMHLFFNMFSLFIFGRILEQVWGSKRFLFYYLSTGLGAGLIQEITWMLTATSSFVLIDGNGFEAMSGTEAITYALSHGIDVGAYYNSMITIGASGAVFGILLAFGMMFPNAPMYLMFIPIPIKAKYLVIGYGAFELMFGVAGIQQGVAHFAHLGGMLVGFLILLYWKKKGVFGGRRY